MTKIRTTVVMWIILYKILMTVGANGEEKTHAIYDGSKTGSSSFTPPNKIWETPTKPSIILDGQKRNYDCSKITFLGIDDDKSKSKVPENRRSQSSSGKPFQDFRLPASGNSKSLPNFQSMLRKQNGFVKFQSNQKKDPSSNRNWRLKNGLLLPQLMDKKHPQKGYLQFGNKQQVLDSTIQLSNGLVLPKGMISIRNNGVSNTTGKAKNATTSPTKSPLAKIQTQKRDIAKHEMQLASLKDRATRAERRAEIARSERRQILFAVVDNAAIDRGHP